MDGPKSFQDNASELDDSTNYENVAESESSDRLSELPNSFIFHILSLLPMRDVVRTTLLSKRWENLWTTVPCLNFNDDREYFDEDDTDALDVFVNFVDRVLKLWKGSKIMKFHIIFYYDDSLCSCLDKWLDVVLEHEVEELYINLECELDLECNISSYSLPQRLYSCSSIRKLSLVSCCLKPSGNVHWDKLRSLSIGRVCLEERVMNQVLSGSPQLEILNLFLWESKNHLNIQSSSLNRLKIQKILDEDNIAAMDTVLTICAPNVEILEMSGAMYCMYLLMNVSSLTDVTLAFSDENSNIFYEHESGEEWSDDEMDSHGSRNEMLMQVFQSIRQVENLALSHWCIQFTPFLLSYQALGEMMDNLHSLPSDAKFLKLYVSEDIKPIIAGVLEMFPKLTMLVLEHADPSMYEKTFHEYFDEENHLRFEKRFRESCLPHLSTVEIIWIGCDASMLVDFFD